ncbi:MAG: hypothetical protein LJE89_13900 [Deltaproteobacteria bacterium]|nr:hypothetical protein [Deltaproteobacteria bacterium]
MERISYKSSALFTWMVIIGLLVFVLIKGTFSFLLIGDQGQPTWDYRPVKDVPGESPYAIYQLVPHTQHIRGQKGE